MTAVITTSTRCMGPYSSPYDGTLLTYCFDIDYLSSPMVVLVRTYRSVLLFVTFLVASPLLFTGLFHVWFIACHYSNIDIWFYILPTLKHCMLCASSTKHVGESGQTCYSHQSAGNPDSCLSVSLFLYSHFL